MRLSRVFIAAILRFFLFVFCFCFFVFFFFVLSYFQEIVLFFHPLAGGFFFFFTSIFAACHLASSSRIILLAPTSLAVDGCTYMLSRVLTDAAISARSWLLYSVSTRVRCICARVWVRILVVSCCQSVRRARQSLIRNTYSWRRKINCLSIFVPAKRRWCARAKFFSLHANTRSKATHSHHQPTNFSHWQPQQMRHTMFHK